MLVAHANLFEQVGATDQILRAGEAHLRRPAADVFAEHLEDVDNALNRMFLNRAARSA